MSDVLGTPPEVPGTPAPGSARKHRGALIAVIVAVVLAAGGGGAAVAVINHRADVAAADRAEARRVAAVKAEQARLAAERERKAREAAELAAKQKVYDSCVGELSGLMDALGVVDARLDVGLSQNEFSHLVGDASVAYSRIDIHALGKGVCLAAGAQLETALNSYSTVASKWNDCIYDYYCDMDSIDPMMQRNWSSASRNITRAKKLVDSLDPSNPTSSGPGSNA